MNGRVSSNGRTSDSDSECRGSSPCTRANSLTQSLCKFQKNIMPAELLRFFFEIPMNIYRNPFILALWAPIYQLVATVAITNDFLMLAIFIMCTLGLLGAYVSDFPVFSTLYMNEVAHKTAVSSLLGMLLGFILFMAFGTGGNEGTDGGTVSAGGKFVITWAILSLPAYPLMTYLIFGLNKRDLDAENVIRKEKKKNRQGPPIMKKDGF